MDIEILYCSHVFKVFKAKLLLTSLLIMTRKFEEQIEHMPDARDMSVSLAVL